MERMQLKTQMREDTGKRPTKLLRKEGIVPAVVYREGRETVHVKVDQSDLIHVLHTKAGANVLINLKVESGSKGKEKDRVVIIKDIQHHPIKEQILHVDFQEISLTEKLQVDVPIQAKGEAEGVIKDEGVMEHVLWEIKVECLPADIPEKIEVDVTNMKIGDSVLLKDLQVPAGVKVLGDPEHTVISVVPPHEEAPAEEPGEEMAEPELIREKKEEEEVPEEGAEGAPPEAKKEGGKEK